jgi:Ca2+-binding RTX toxin-like protein
MRRHAQLLLAVAAAALLALGLAPPAGATLNEPDLCGDINSGQSTHLLNSGIGDGTPGKEFLCGDTITDIPAGAEVEPDQDAPDAIDSSGDFDTNYAYIIGPNGAAANWTGISGTQVLVAAAEGIGEGVAVSAFIAWAFPPATLAATFTSIVAGAVANTLVNIGTQIWDDYSDMSGSDWDFFVPADSGSGDWNGWLAWDGLGEVQTVSIDPHILNSWWYDISDYADESPPVYVRLYTGVSQRPVSQGDGIVQDAWNVASDGGNAFASGAARQTPQPVGRVGIARVVLEGNRTTRRGTPRNDELSVKVGNHTLDGRGGHDQLGGGPGDDVLVGGPGHDELRAFNGNDQLLGGPGHDLLFGHAGDDALVGGAGDDMLIDGPGRRSGGRSIMIGGPGRDFLVARDGRGDDELRCGPGRDVALADPSDTIAKDCERAMVRRPPRGTKPPSMGHPVGRPPGAAQPEWGFETMLRSHEVRARAGRGKAPRYSDTLDAALGRIGRRSVR